jgi:hypothetical protein
MLPAICRWTQQLASLVVSQAGAVCGVADGQAGVEQAVERIDQPEVGSLPRLDRGATRPSGGADEFAALRGFGLRTLGLADQPVDAMPLLAVPRRDPISLTRERPTFSKLVHAPSTAQRSASGHVRRAKQALTTHPLHPPERFRPYETLECGDGRTRMPSVWRADAAAAAHWASRDLVLRPLQTCGVRGATRGRQRRHRGEDRREGRPTGRPRRRRVRCSGHGFTGRMSARARPPRGAGA